VGLPTNPNRPTGRRSTPPLTASGDHVCERSTHAPTQRPPSGGWFTASEARAILNTGIAIAMNVAVLVSLLWLNWPAQAMFGK
jgi:hypothetical protein